MYDYSPSIVIDYIQGGTYLTVLIWGMLTLQFIAAIAMYIWIYRLEKIENHPIGSNIAMVVGGGMALGTGILLVYEFPFYYMEVTGISTVVGILTGGLFGKLFNKQAKLSGYVSGLMTGMMAPMVGAAALYSLPFMIMIEIFIVSSFCILTIEMVRNQTEEKRQGQ